MAEITLLAKDQARPGYEFVYMGGAPPCRPCPYRNACLTLDAGRRYAVRAVRPVEHPCALQERPANVVEVEPRPRTLLVEPRSAIAGSTVETGRFACARLDCRHWDDCAGPSLPAKQRYRIESIEPGAADCLIGRTLKRVQAV